MGNAAYAKGKHFDWLLSGPKPAVYNAPGWTCRHQQRHNTFERRQGTRETVTKWGS